MNRGIVGASEYMPLPQDKALWTLLTLSLNAAHSVLVTKPALFRDKYSPGPEGVLNAYRQGDLSLDGAVEALEEWKGRVTPPT